MKLDLKMFRAAEMYEEGFNISAFTLFCKTNMKLLCSTQLQDWSIWRVRHFCPTDYPTPNQDYGVGLTAFKLNFTD
ncbi:hypothetical protein [Mastigocoleus sp. MO_188.B34]|uniref:hypothetical protein n=1 Tax=Mastigocoleus sp. MO_188.B34 TaxID=3036635 RepID=UPI0026316073|nr:hypothetical protein [Mastigocoleus sp. MO_188.B34]MDJ0693519.1 hypothetical protein [Mastigocoleus sp. MO_188.B34]